MPIRRNFGLDLIRFIAIILVLIHHLTPFFQDYLPFGNHYITILGYYGVEVFFVLSGFLIGNIILKTYIDNATYCIHDIKTFWRRRWLRTIPLYIVILSVHVAFDIVTGQEVDRLWRYFFFFQNIFGHYDSFFGVSWSLAVEEWYYITLPLALFLFTRAFKNFITKKQILLITILTYIILVLTLKIVYSTLYTPNWNSGIRKSVLFRLDSIAFGALLSYFYTFHRLLWVKLKYKFAFAGIVLSVFCISYFMIYISHDYFGSINEVPFFGKTFYFSIVNASIALFLPAAFYLDTRFPFIKRSITHISKISYSLYLVHPFVIILLRHVLKDYHPDVRLFLGLILFFTISIILSSITYSCIEEPFMKLREQKAKRKKVFIQAVLEKERV